MSGDMEAGNNPPEPGKHVFATILLMFCADGDTLSIFSPDFVNKLERMFTPAGIDPL